MVEDGPSLRDPPVGCLGEAWSPRRAGAEAADLGVALTSPRPLRWGQPGLVVGVWVGVGLGGVGMPGKVGTEGRKP